MRNRETGTKGTRRRRQGMTGSRWFYARSFAGRATAAVRNTETTETAQRLTEGARVKVVQYPKTPKEEREIVGRHGAFVEYTQPHGYARVALDDELGDTHLVHPENLMAECLCSVIDCGSYANDESDFCPKHY